MLYRKIKLNVPDLHHEFSIDTLGVVRNETLGKVLKGTSISNHNRYVKIHLQKFHALHRLVSRRHRKIRLAHLSKHLIDHDLLRGIFVITEHAARPNQNVTIFTQINRS